MTWKDFFAAGSPLDGNFTVEADRALMVPLMVKYLAAFATFHSIVKGELGNDEATWEDHSAQPFSMIQKGFHSREIYHTPAEYRRALLPESYTGVLEASLVSHQAHTSCQ